MNSNLKNEIFGKLLELAPTTLTAEKADTIEKIMKLIDKLVESEVINARLEVMKNFKLNCVLDVKLLCH